MPPRAAVLQLPDQLKPHIATVCDSLYRLLGLKSPALSQLELQALDSALGALIGHASRGDGSLMNEISSHRSLGACMAQLSAFGVRQPISAVDSPQARLLHSVAQRSVELLGGMVVTSAGIALPDAAEKAIRALASTVVKTQVLEAAARQAAAVASALSPAAGGAGAAAAAAAAGAGPAAGAGAADAPAGAGNVCLRTRAADMVGACALLVNSLAVFAKRRQDKDLGRALLQALRASLLLDHLARLVLLLGPNLPPAPAALVQKQKGVMLWLGRAIGAVRAVPGLVGEPAPLEIAKTFGPSGCNALLLLGASTLAMADLQPCGLPANMLLALPLDRSAAYPCLEVYALQASLLALKRDQESPQPTVPPRAALRLLLRALQLAAASVRPDASVPVERTPDGLLRIDMSWTNDRRVGTQTYGALLSKAQAILLAEVTVMHLNAVTARRPDAWIAEAPRSWALLLSAVRHLMEPDANAMQGKLMQLLVKLLDDATWPIQSRPGEGPSLILPPAQLLPSVVGVVAGGVVRSLETLLRCITDYPEGPEVQIISGLCQHLIPSKALGLMLIHTPPREAIAFINTLRKLLRRILPLAMLHAGLDSSTVCLMLACAIVEMAMDAAIADEARAEPSRAVDASTQRAPVFVLSYAMLALLPELARIARSVVTLMLMESVATRRRMMGAPGRTMVAGAIEVLTRMQWQAVAFTKQRYNGFAPEHRLAWVTGVHFATSELLAVPMLGSFLDIVQQQGGLPEGSPGFLHNVGTCCLSLYEIVPELVRHRGEAAPGQGAGGSSAAGVWKPEALQEVARTLRARERDRSNELASLAETLQRPRSSLSGAEGEFTEVLAKEAERLAALKAEARALLPTCANPLCVELDGDSEAGIPLQLCGRCRQVSYCCRDCQAAHWRTGHKSVCQAVGS